MAGRNCIPEIHKDYRDIVKGLTESIKTEMLSFDPDFRNVVDDIRNLGKSTEKNLNICDLLDINKEDNEICIRGVLTASEDTRNNIADILSNRWLTNKEK